MKTRKKWSIERKILASFGSIVLILLVVEIISYDGINRLIDSSHQAQSSQEVIVQIKDVLGAVVDAETSQRGYVITGDETFLEPYLAASPLIGEKIRKLRELTADDPYQQERIPELEASITGKFDELQRVINTKQTAGNEAAQQIIANRAGKNFMDNIRRLLGEMETHEATLLAARTDGVDATGRRARFYFFVLLVAVAGLLSTGYFMIRRDNRARRTAEENLKTLNNELEDRVAERTQQLEEANKELVRSNEELQLFAYVASHDLQEPLRMVASYTQLLSRRYKGKLDEDADDFIGFAVDGANRMQGLINDLLAYSRVGTKGKPLTPYNANDALELALSNLQVAIEDSGAVITHDELPVVMADSTQLTQLFQNLIGNAIKFSVEKPPRIEIGVKKQGGEWQISVHDNGIGIDPEYMERVFVIFQRLHTRDEYSGSGIGLAICKKVVERHEGRIWVESKKGEGSTFYFTLPLYNPERDDDIVANSAAGTRGWFKKRKSPKKELVEESVEEPREEKGDE